MFYIYFFLLNTPEYLPSYLSLALLYSSGKVPINDIINPFLFTENYDSNSDIKDIISDRLSFMDRFRIICKIAKIYNINNFKKLLFS